MAPRRIACVVGTRPEAIKLAPVVLCARAQPQQFSVTVVATGQHRDIARDALNDFGVEPDIDLDVMRDEQQPTDVLARVVAALPQVFGQTQPEVVLVQGDTTTTLAGALAAFHMKIPVGHVEAGLRTTDRYSPFPEEMNRRLVTQLASWHFAPTDAARVRLLREGVAPASITVTGNTVIDALHRLRATSAPPPALRVPAGSRLVLLTCHRRENHGAPMREICAGVRDLVGRYRDLFVACAVHPNPAVQSVVAAELSSTPRVQLLPPVRYTELLWLLDACAIVMTDSGGIQEEAPAFNKPVLVLRDTTERPEGIDAGVARLVGTSRQAIAREAGRLLDDADAYARMARGTNPYGDGRASERILHALARRELSTASVSQLSGVAR